MAEAMEKCPCCFKTADMEPVEVKRDGKWVASTVRRCVNPECHSVREGTLEDRIAHLNSVYGYKYFGDYELSPEQLDAVLMAWGLACRVPALEAETQALRAQLERLTDREAIARQVDPEAFGATPWRSDAVRREYQQVAYDAADRIIALHEGGEVVSRSALTEGRE